MSDHFSLHELTFSATAQRHGVVNTPDDESVQNLSRLCLWALEPARLIVGPMKVNSGYRNAELNHLVGGGITSAHLEGRACDFVPVTFAVKDAWEALKGANIPYDQLIIEHSPKTGSTWIHIAIAQEGIKPRRQAFPLTKREDRAHEG